MPAHYLLATGGYILLHPEGGMFLEGFSVYRSYLKPSEKIRVTMHVFRAARASQRSSLLADDMSETERRIVAQWLAGCGPLTHSTPNQGSARGRDGPF